MKKVLSGLMIAAVVALALVGALAVIPHSHGSDLDHSQHASCPIHQLGSIQLHTVFNAVTILFLAFIVFYLTLSSDNPCQKIFSSSFSSRAPPARI